ncbi:MAG: DUF6266 family protein, partial [Marinifilaceae bacterium]
SSWRGVNYLRTLPGPNTSNTEKQQQQRSRFKAITGLASTLMGSLIRPVWNKATQQMTGYNLFVKTNMPAFNQDGQLANYGEFHASVGNLPLPSELTIQDDTETTSGIELTWEDESATGIGNADDKLRLLVMDASEMHVINSDVLRSAETASITLPLAAGTVQVYAFFGSDAGDAFSGDKHQEVSLT